jgi:para-nitrobenzyl esterase
VIAESGSPFNFLLRPLTEAEQENEKLLAGLKLPASGELKDLRERSVRELLEAVGKQDPQGLPVESPIVDGWVLPRSPAEIFAAGQQAPAALLIGTTTREFGMAAPVAAVRSFIQSVTGNLADRAFTLYGLANGGTGNIDPMYGSAGDQWFADLVFRCPITTEAAWHTAANHPLYEYEFQHAIPGQEAQGAVHSADLPYVFGYFPKQGNISGNFGEIDFKLADLIEIYWTNFAKTGDPNSSGVPKWPEFGKAQGYIEFTQDGRVASATGLRRPQCDLYRDVLKQRLNGHH